jgi:thiol-disulfide isomerase/thioredoxin
VAFTAAWCAPCVRFHPKFLELSAVFPDVAFISVDIDQLDDHTLDTMAVETVWPGRYWFTCRPSTSLRGTGP